MAPPDGTVLRGAWYHLVNRGAARGNPFPSPEDAAAFVRLLAEVPRRFGVEIHAYCVMSSHYHLLARSREPILARAARFLDEGYTRRHRGVDGTSGALFRAQGRAVLVGTVRHALHVSRYIHLNPVEAGLVPRAEDWPYSSFPAYLDPALAPPWLRTLTILGTLGSIGARERYRRFVEVGIDPGSRDRFGRARLRDPLDEGGLQDEILHRIGSASGGPPGAPPATIGLASSVPLGAIASAVCREFGLPPGTLRSRGAGGGRTRGLARGALVHAARRLGGHRLREIARFLGYRGHAAAARAAIRFQEAAAADPALAGRLRLVLDGFDEPLDPGWRSPDDLSLQ